MTAGREPCHRVGTAAVIPAYDEAERIGATVRAVAGLADVDLVLVVDDGSRDDTSQEAAAAGARVLRLAANQGKGAALNAGMAQVRAAIYLFLDADLGASAAEAQRLLGPVMAADADLTVATLPAGPGAGMGLAVGLARWAVAQLCGRQLEAPLSGQRALTHRTWKAVRPMRPGFGAELGMTLRALKAGLIVREVATPMTHRVTGWGARHCLHRARQGFDVATTVLAILPEVVSQRQKDIHSNSVNV